MLIPGDTQHHCDTSAKAAVSRGHLIDEALARVHGHLIDEALARVQLAVGH